jgi:hypothetical protein
MRGLGRSDCVSCSLVSYQDEGISRVTQPFLHFRGIPFHMFSDWSFASLCCAWQCNRSVLGSTVCCGWIRTHDLSRRATVDLRLRPLGHWDLHRLANSSYIHLHRIVDYITKMCSSRVHLWSLICSGTATIWTLIIGPCDIRSNLIYTLHALVIKFCIRFYAFFEVLYLRN